MGRISRRFRELDALLAGLKAGLITATALALVGGLIVLLVVIALHPSGAAHFVGHPQNDIAIVILFALFVPNAATGAVLASMGATIRESASFFGSHATSVGIFGASGEGASQVHVPAYWLAAALIPIIATTVAGYTAARAAEPTPGARGRAAVLAGLAMAPVLWVLAFMSSITITVASVAGGSLSVSPAATFFLPILWGGVGGWVGGIVFAQREQGRTRASASTGLLSPGPAEPSWPEPSPPSPSIASEPTTAPPEPPPTMPPPTPPLAAPTKPPPPGVAGPREPPRSAIELGVTRLAPAEPSAGGLPPEPLTEPITERGMEDASDRRSTPDRIFCTSCGAPNPATNRFCEACGRPLGDG